MINGNDIISSYNLIRPHISRTPILHSDFLNELLGHELYFKAENLQTTGSFKVRGVLNYILSLQKQGALPEKIVAYSSGNHGQALAWIGNKFGIKTKIFYPETASDAKIELTKGWGADVVITKTRLEAEVKSQEEATKTGAAYLPPSDHDYLISGAGTIVHEALMDLGNVSAVFGPCGGGALISGTCIAAKSFNQNIKVFAAEPKSANDVATSLKNNKIFRFSDSPKTIADGARTLGVSEKIFEYLKKLDGVFEIPEEEIIYWCVWVSEILKIRCEPTSALAMAAAYKWLKNATTKQKVLILISGGNLDQIMGQMIANSQYLQILPNKELFSINDMGE